MERAMMSALRWLVRKSQVAMLPQDARSVLRDRLTYLSPEKISRLTRAVDDVVDRQVPGDILEFGVALGGSSVLLARRVSPERQFHGFDVFGLIPPPNSAKDDAKSKERYQVISSGQSIGIGGDGYYGYRHDLYESVSGTLARFGRPVDGRSVFLHKGLFAETWLRYARPQVAFAHIDCDWYDPVELCLNAVLTRLAPGGIIALDDYHDYGGCRAATDEFLGAHPGVFAVDDGPNLILRRVQLR
ncbi:MAG: TylF/MycF family methyltransferase [Pseudomonadota bacterium]|nr:TylF/MycF family methyltransferase [Pseudomonadota bacterium]